MNDTLQNTVSDTVREKLIKRRCKVLKLFDRKTLEDNCPLSEPWHLDQKSLILSIAESWENHDIRKLTNTLLDRCE
jgi:hypothetical protein